MQHAWVNANLVMNFSIWMCHWLCQQWSYCRLLHKQSLNKIIPAVDKLTRQKIFCQLNKLIRCVKSVLLSILIKPKSLSTCTKECPLKGNWRTILLNLLRSTRAIKKRTIVLLLLFRPLQLSQNIQSSYFFFNLFIDVGFQKRKTSFEPLFASPSWCHVTWS
jgi:hypothetical protein